MSSPIASVIVPVFNRQAVIGDAVVSLARQTLEDIEIIVVDDGSADASAEVAERAGGKRVRVIRHTNNRGIPAARNTGLVAARGKYIAWLDSDDLARPTRLERQASFLARNSEISLVGSAAELVEPNGTRKRGRRVPFLAHETLAPALLFRSPFQQSSIMGTAETLKAFEYRPDFPVCEDLDMFIRISRKHRIANMKDVLIDRRLHEGQIGRSEKSLVRDRKSVLFRELLREMGIDPSDEDLQRHVTLGALKKQPQSREFVAWAERWMKDLRVANGPSGRYDRNGLALVCARAWFRACHVAMHGKQRLPVAGTMVASSLTLGIANSTGLGWLADMASGLVGARRGACPGRR